MVTLVEEREEREWELERGDNPNMEYCYSESFISPSSYFTPGIEFQDMEPTDYQLLDNGEVDAVDNFWNVKDIWSLQQQFNSNM